MNIGHRLKKKKLTSSLTNPFEEILSIEALQGKQEKTDIRS